MSSSDNKMTRNNSAPSVMLVDRPPDDGHDNGLDNGLDDGLDDDFFCPPSHPIICGMSSTGGGFAYRCHMSSREKHYMCEQAFKADGLPMNEYSAWNWLRTRPKMQVKYNVSHIFH